MGLDVSHSARYPHIGPPISSSLSSPAWLPLRSCWAHTLRWRRTRRGGATLSAALCGRESGYGMAEQTLRKTRSAVQHGSADNVFSAPGKDDDPTNSTALCYRAAARHRTVGDPCATVRQHRPVEGR